MEEAIFNRYYNTYLEEVKTKYLPCFILLGKLELLHELHPERHWDERINNLPKPLLLDYVSEISYYFKYPKLKFNIDFFVENIQHSFYIYYDTPSAAWTVDKCTQYYGVEEEDLEAEEEQKIIEAYPIDHPAFTNIIFEKTKMVQSYLEREHIAFSYLSMEKDRLYFKFENNDELFSCSENGDKARVCRKPKLHVEHVKQVFRDDYILEYMLGHTSMWERIANHPNIRLKKLF